MHDEEGVVLPYKALQEYTQKLGDLTHTLLNLDFRQMSLLKAIRQAAFPSIPTALRCVDVKAS